MYSCGIEPPSQTVVLMAQLETSIVCLLHVQLVKQFALSSPLSLCWKIDMKQKLAESASFFPLNSIKWENGTNPSHISDHQLYGRQKLGCAVLSYTYDLTKVELTKNLFHNPTIVWTGLLQCIVQQTCGHLIFAQFSFSGICWRRAIKY